MGRALKLRTSGYVAVFKRDENRLLHMLVVEPEEAEDALHALGEGAFIFDWGEEVNE